MTTKLYIISVIGIRIDALLFELSESGVVPETMAGSPQPKAAPSGMSEILRKAGRDSLGVSGGLTLIQHAAAFTPPSFVTTKAHERTGSTVSHYALVQPTQAQDATHESYYPTFGEHIRPGMVQRISGKIYTHYWLVSQPISDLIRQGEQEHLDDAQRAYDLTYQTIQDAINAMGGKRFGPANTPAEAEKLALDELARRLPPELGTDPTNWVRMLDTLLVQSKSRDDNNWHSMRTDPPRTVGNKILHPVVVTDQTDIGNIGSSKVVNF